MVSDRLLILGCGAGELPLISAARRQGLEVFTCGDDPQGLAHANSDGQVLVDFSNPKLVLQAFQKVGAKYVVAGANDFAEFCGSEISNALGLVNFDTPKVTSLLHHKDSFRELAKTLRIMQPNFVCIRNNRSGSDIGTLGFPVIVKPNDLTGGKGMEVVDSKDKLERAIRKSMLESRSGNVVVEEFIQGSHHGFSTVLVNGEVVYSFMDTEQYGINRFMVLGTTYPSTAGTELEGALLEVASLLARSLRLTDGLLHLQFVTTPTGPCILEVCRRLPGDLYPWFTYEATGVDLADVVIACAIQGEIHPKPGRRRYILRRCLTAKAPGVISSLPQRSSLGEFLDASRIWDEPGVLVSDHARHKSGIAFVEANSATELYNYVNSNQINVDFEVKTAELQP